MPEAILVGDWTFSPATASLCRGEERRRLEHRAALVLETLCRRSGSPVSAAELVEQVWGGRALSPNSVAVVIGDLRRALDDDARSPRYIETIPKRGYRMSVPVTAEAAVAAAVEPRNARLRGLLPFTILALAGAAALAAPALISDGAPAPFRVAITAIPNETGDPANEALARAATDLVGAEIGALPGVRVIRGGDTPVDAILTGRLVLWNGQVSMSLAADDPATSEQLWSVIAAGPAAALPRQIHASAVSFGEHLAPRRVRRVDKRAAAP